ncbi:PREDICTED: uncharacterized protein LOC106848736 [Sturnus vulgaris]|uniref:uncharacterized protein LOC106848736 n=1 Tax=Sturnus vulgaris TaxID=9172 RepID=UPI00071A31EC|nr:PREDICTED: uncharacterized protein LOC106848736 [Sturnus vulgaris]
MNLDRVDIWSLIVATFTLHYRRNMESCLQEQRVAAVPTESPRKMSKHGVLSQEQRCGTEIWRRSCRGEESPAFRGRFRKGTTLTEFILFARSFPQALPALPALQGAPPQAGTVRGLGGAGGGEFRGNSSLPQKIIIAKASVVRCIRTHPPIELTKTRSGGKTPKSRLVRRLCFCWARIACGSIRGIFRAITGVTVTHVSSLPPSLQLLSNPEVTTHRPV